MNSGAINRIAAIQAMFASLLLCLLFLLYLWAVGIEGVPFFSEYKDKTPWDLLIPVMSVLLLFLVTCAVAYLLLTHSLPTWLVSNEDEASQRFVLCCGNWRSIFFTALVMFLCWLPWLVLFYPGVLTNDGLNQLYQYSVPAPTWYMTTNEIYDCEFIDHHPVIDTLIYGFFVYGIGGFANSQNIGMFAFVLVQAALTVFAIAYAVCSLEDLSISHRVRLGLLVIACIFILLPINAAAMLKDTLHAPLFLLFFTMFIRVFRTQGTVLESAKYLVGYILVATACMLSKKTGIYIVIPSLFVAFCFLRNARVFGAAVLPTFICLILVPALVYPAIGGVEKGGIQEAMALFLQESVAVAEEHYDELPDDEIKAVDAIIELDYARDNFDPSVADPAKDTFRKSVTTRDLITYALVWLKQGIRYPLVYLKTTMRCIGSLFVPAEGLSFYQGIDVRYLPAFQEQAEKQGYEFIFEIYEPEKLNSITQELQHFVSFELVTWPFVSLLISKGLYGGWIPLFAFIIVLFCRREYAPLLTPVVLATLTLMMCPVDNARYVFPLLYSCPMILGLMICSANQKPTELGA